MAGFSSDVNFVYPFGTLFEGHNDFKMEVHRRGILYDKKRMLKQSSVNAAKPNEEIHDSEFFGPDDHFEGDFFDESAAILETKVRDPTNFNLRELKQASNRASASIPTVMGEETNSNTPPVPGNNNPPSNKKKESKSRKASDSDYDSSYSKKSQTKAKTEKKVSTPSTKQVKSEDKNIVKDKKIKGKSKNKSTTNIDYSDDSSSDADPPIKEDVGKIPVYVQKLLETQKKNFEKMIESQRLASEKEIENLKNIAKENNKKRKNDIGIELPENVSRPSSKKGRKSKTAASQKPTTSTRSLFIFLSIAFLNNYGCLLNIILVTMTKTKAKYLGRTMATSKTIIAITTKLVHPTIPNLREMNGTALTTTLVHPAKSQEINRTTIKIATTTISHSKTTISHSRTKTTAMI